MPYAPTVSRNVKLLVLNGPNLNLLGRREPEVYGADSLDDVEARVQAALPEAEIAFMQENGEGALIDALHAADADGTDGVVLNPGGYAHTSVALRDAVAAMAVPVVEVHLSNVFTREGFRHRLLIAPAAVGVVSGLGAAGYVLAARYLAEGHAARS